MWFFIILVLLSHGTRVNTDGKKSQLIHTDNYKHHVIVKVKMSDFLLIFLLISVKIVRKWNKLFELWFYVRILLLLLSNHKQKS